MPYELKSKNQAAVLRLGENGLPEHWRLSGGDGLTVYGAEPRAWAVVRRKADRCERTCPLCVETIRKQEDRLLVTFSVSWEQQPAAAVSLSFAAEESGFSFAWEGAEERDGYALLEITVPALVFSAPEEHAQFLHGEHRGGYLADLDTMDENAEIRGEDRFGGYPNASVLPVLCLFRERTMCVMEVQGYVCRTLLDARKEVGISLGVTAPWRIRGGEKTPDLLANQREIVRVDFSGAEPGREKADWMDAARLIRARYAPFPDAFFDDKFVYIIQNQLGRKETELTFEQTEELIARISHLIGGNPHVAFLTGWSQGGHDTSYPNVYTMNPNLGTPEAFQALKRRGKEDYHCTVSLNDNFDDMYRNEYTDGWFRETYVARTRDNELETFETWNGVDLSYITAMHRYMQPGEDGEKRIRHHGEVHRLSGAILIDALSWWSIRNDFNPDAPASAVENLRAKFRILETFYRTYGIHVCSELVRYPFFGKLRLAFDNGVCYDAPSDHDVPFLREVLRGVMVYGGKGGDALDVADLLYHNAAKHPWFRRGETARRITDIYYLNYVPWFLLHRLAVTGYRVENGVYRIHLEHAAEIGIDTAAGNWYASYEGVRILENDRLTCPLGRDTIAFYAHEDCTLETKLPARAHAAGASACLEEGPQPHPFEEENGVLRVSVKACVPVIVTLAQDQ